MRENRQTNGGKTLPQRLPSEWTKSMDLTVLPTNTSCVTELVNEFIPETM